MDIISKKLNFVQEFLKISDESLIDELEKFLKAKRGKGAELEFKPMSICEFQEMIDRAEDDISLGKVTETGNLLKKVKKWR